MHIFDFDPETNGIELSWRDTGGEISRREARPVYAEELTMAKGMKHRGQYNAYPIIDWSSAEVWLYIYTHNLPVNAGYRKGNRRAGCLVCLAAFFHTTPDDLQAKIDAFRDDGCSLFE